MSGTKNGSSLKTIIKHGVNSLNLTIMHCLHPMHLFKRVFPPLLLNKLIANTEQMKLGHIRILIRLAE